jgi:hypothetical protein
MANRDRNPDTSIIGRDADTAKGARGRDVRMTASTDDAAEECEDLEIIFEREEPTTTH